MKDKNDIDKNLEKYVRRGSTSGMKVPDNYFDDLQQNVMARLDEEPSGARQITMRTWLTLAASIAVVAISAVAVLQRSNEQAPSESFADISTEEAYEYVYLNADAFAAEEIFSALNIEDSEASSLDLEETNYAIDELLEEFSREDLESIF